MSDEVIINDNVDNLLVKMEGYFKEAVDGQKPLQEELNKKVEELMKEYDAKEEIVRFEKMKALADYIALTVSMPLSDETKEKVIEELVKGCEENVVSKEV